VNRWQFRSLYLFPKCSEVARRDELQHRAAMIYRHAIELEFCQLALRCEEHTNNVAANVVVFSLVSAATDTDD
jgi:hypothetical protein